MDNNYLKKYCRLIFNFQKPRNWVVWGTYGKNGDKPLEWKYLKDMSNEHIQAVLNTQKQITNFYHNEFKNELILRIKKPNLAILENK